MKNTPAHQTLIVKGLRRKQWKQADLAKALGVEPPTISRLLDGTTKTISDEMRIGLETVLGIEFFKVVEQNKLSTLANQIAARFDSDASFAAVVMALHENMITPTFTPRYVPTQEMTDLGKRIAAIIQNPKNADKYGKIARQVLELLA